MYLLGAIQRLELSLIETLICSDRNSCATSLQTESQRRVTSRFVPRATHLAHAKPVFENMFDTMRRNELVLHLSFKTPALKLDILSAAVSQLIDPDVAVFVSSPRPRFLAGQFAMVGHVDHTPIRLFVINAEVVALGIARKERKEVWHLTKPPDIDSLFDRKFEDGPEGMWVRFAHRVVEP